MVVAIGFLHEFVERDVAAGIAVRGRPQTPACALAVGLNADHTEGERLRGGLLGEGGEGNEGSGEEQGAGAEVGHGGLREVHL